LSGHVRQRHLLRSATERLGRSDHALVLKRYNRFSGFPRGPRAAAVKTVSTGDQIIQEGLKPATVSSRAGSFND
jgi:hypothetical protein